MNPEELSERLDRLEKHMSFVLGNQVSILEAQEELLAKLNRTNRKPATKNEFLVMLNYFLFSLAFYGLMHME